VPQKAGRRIHRAAFVLGCALAAACLQLRVHAQELLTPAPATVVHGLYNWVHSTGDAERAFAFYRDVFAIELAPSPFIPNATVPDGIRPLADVVGDPLIWELTDTQGSRARTVFMRASNTPFGIELSEFVDIPRSVRAANPWDPGASRLMFRVRDLDVTVAKLAERSAPIVTRGAAPVGTQAGRAVLVRDPDGYLVEVSQATAAEIASAAASGPIIGTSIGLTVESTQRSLELYRDLLGFAVRETRQAEAAELALNGLAAGSLEQTVTVIPGTAIAVVLADFTLPAAVPAQAFRWRIQDVGSPQFQLEVRGLDALIERTRSAGYRFLSVGARPIRRPFGRFVFAIDADHILVEYAEPGIAR
jgi:catechol 2,3-dioxygenase-like lactoylglutathione lyase family enzyme